MVKMEEQDNKSIQIMKEF